MFCDAFRSYVYVHTNNLFRIGLMAQSNLKKLSCKNLKCLLKTYFDKCIHFLFRYVIKAKKKKKETIILMTLSQLSSVLNAMTGIHLM